MPKCVWPNTIMTNVLLGLLATQAVLCLTDADQYPMRISAVLKPLQQWLLRLFQSRSALHIFFYCTLLIHALEALYALMLIRRALGGRFGGIHASLWALQTCLLGFPSLLLLMRLLSDMHGEQTKNLRHMTNKERNE